MLRTSYPGITKLVIVESYLNKTPAGITALNTVAAYNSALATATTDGTIQPARRLASKSCAACHADADRIESFIKKRQQVVRSDGSANRWKSVALYLSQVTDSGALIVQFDGVDSTVQLRSTTGRVLDTQSGSLESDDEEVASSGTVIASIRPRV